MEKIFLFSILLIIIIIIVNNFGNCDGGNIYKNLKFKNSKIIIKTLTKQAINTKIGKISFDNNNNSETISEIDFKLNLLYSIDRNTQTSSDNDDDDDDLFKIIKRDDEIELITNKILIQSKNYIYNLIVKNKTNFIISNNLRLIIKVFNEDHLIPKFLINPYNIQISENTPLNSLILKVSSFYTDNNNNDDNDGLSTTNENVNSVVYKLIEENEYFSLNSNTGEIQTKKRLNSLSSFKLTINSINYNLPQYAATTTVNIRIIDNYNLVTLFNQTDYEISLSESQDYINKPVIFKLPSSSNSRLLNYQLIGSKIDLNTFEINQFDGTIKLIDKLDHELKSEYKLTIVVTDSSLQPIGYSYINLIIKIIDINNNPPKFTEQTYYFNILNTSSISSNLIVGYIDAYDRDSVLRNNSKIGYFIQNYKLYSQFPFQIDLLNGSIYLTKTNELKLNLYDFNVIAKDRYGVELDCLSSTVNVKIKIISINENYLFKFDSQNYNLNLSEDTVVGTELAVFNILNLIDKNTILNFLINSGNTENTFSINKFKKTVAQLSLARSFDYRKQSFYSLVIKAIDNSGLYATLNVFVNIIPINLQQPRFTKDLYEFQVYENSSIGTLIGNVNAIDGDSGDNGRLEYSLVDSQMNFDFKLDEINGNLFVASKLDREVYDSITLYVTAADNGSPKRTDRALVKLKILDCNDNRPEFTKDGYKVTISEDSKIGTYIMRVEATDRDLGQNSIIRYSFLKNNSSPPPFTIDQVSGIIRVSGKLDREDLQDSYNITLIATDLGEIPLSSNSTLIIEIADVNDNAPNFGSTQLNFYLFENEPISTEIGSITASDPDIGTNADIVYKMLDGFEYFDIRPSGRYNTITLTSKFVGDFESDKKIYEFNLRAYSGSLFTDTLVQVSIKDVNDNRPSLKNPFKIIFNNYKNNFLIESFAKIPAHDLDSNDNLTFSLVDSIGKQFITLNSMTGEIVLKPILNSNNQINARFLVQVSDGVHEAVEAVCQLSVLMVTDNMLTESVTLSLVNEDIDQFLEYKYENFTSSIKNIPIFSNKNTFVHLFNIQSGSGGVNVTLAVSRDYLKDIFISSEILKQTLYSYLRHLEKSISLHSIKIYQDLSCAIEPCLNFQQCITNVIFSGASKSFLYSPSLQFRAINIQHEFACSCSNGFTGAVSSINCDLEINLCYSNPCGQNGVCISLESNYHCICDNDFTGRNCEFNILKCCDKTSDTTCFSNHHVDFRSFNLEKESRPDTICKNTAECKNDEFCELSTKHFPSGKNAYILVPGIKNRMRFKIKLTFSTIKSDGYLFYNGRFNSIGNDFISLEILNGKLLFSYSFGDYEAKSMLLSGLDVSDGRWHTVTLKYLNRNFTLSVDNDNNQAVDACDLAGMTTNECVSIKFSHKLEQKCSNQFEPCFRYFDFNSPLHIGRGSLDLNKKENYFEGCISDLNINEMFIDLSDDNILNFGTENGCQPKNKDLCKENFSLMCKKCESIWNETIKCSCSSNDFIESSYCQLKLIQNIFSFNSYGYLFITELLKEDLDGLKMEFYVRFRGGNLNSSVIFDLELVSSNERVNRLTLKHSSSEMELALTDEKNINLIQMPYSAFNDGFWHKISFSINRNMTIELTINDLFKKFIKNDRNLLFENHLVAKWFIGGSQMSGGIDGCIKEVQRDLNYIPFQIVNGSDSCDATTFTSFTKNLCGSSSQVDSPCFNNGKCRQIENKFTCECLEGFKGEYCQHPTLISSMRLISISADKLSCPAKWWGTDPRICGPCDCDEKLNFSPDCNKSNGKCECKSKYYKKFNSITKNEYCVPCDCNLEGSSSLECQSNNGQCSCLKDSGITGRRCDSCISPFAEITINNKGTAECQVLNTNECPKTFFNNIWWQRTPFNSKANSSCPKGSTGVAYRTCSEDSGWNKITNLFNCESNKLYEFQLIKWHEELVENKSELNSYQAIKLAENLNQLTEEADLDDNDDFYENDNDDFYENDDDDDYENLFPKINYLYANDLLIIKNLTIFLINFELENAPSLLYIQDKFYLKHFFSTINRLFSKKYEKQWIHLKKEKMETLIDLVFALDKYLNFLLKYVLEQKILMLEQINLNLSNLQVSMSSSLDIILQDKTTRSIKFKLTESNKNQTFDENIKISYLTAKIQPNTLPTRLLLNNDANRQLVNFKVASDIIMINVNENSSFNAFVEFKLKNEKLLSTILMKSLYCVYLNEEKQLWSTYGAKIVSIDNDRNTIKCLYSHFSIYAIMMPINYSNLNTVPVPFSLTTYIFISISIIILLFSVLLLLLLRRLNTALTIVYTNFCFNLFLLQIIFISGLNNTTSSTIMCKLIAVILHYLHLSTYLWILIISLHLYRMLTELRDINKVGSKAPVIYYAIAYVIPSILISLTLSIKQDLYSSTFFSNKASTYCWLNLTNIYDIIYSLALPALLIITFSILLLILSYKESIRKTFKQTDVRHVRYSMTCVLVLLLIHSLSTTFIYLQLNSLNIKDNLFVIYENLYLVISLVYSILILFLFIICDRHTKLSIYKNVFERIIGKNIFLDQSLSASKDYLCNKSPYSTDKKKDLVDINTKYMIDYRCNNQTQSNSASTTTGTLENLDNLDELVNDLNGIGGKHVRNNNNSNESGYNIASSLGGYTTTFSTTDTTTNGSDANYHIDYNNTHTLSTESSTTSTTTPSLSPSSSIKIPKYPIRNCDIIDVSKVLKTREINNRHSPKINKKSTNLIVNDESIHEIKSYKIDNNNFTDISNHTEDTDTIRLPISERSDSFFEKQLRIEENCPTLVNSNSDDWTTGSKTRSLNNSHTKKPLFWPNALAECDLSVLESSSFLSNFSPTKQQQQPLMNQNGMIPDVIPVISCSTGKKTSTGMCSIRFIFQMIFSNISFYTFLSLVKFKHINNVNM